MRWWNGSIQGDCNTRIGNCCYVSCPGSESAEYAGKVLKWVKDALNKTTSYDEAIAVNADDAEGPCKVQVLHTLF